MLPSLEMSLCRAWVSGQILVTSGRKLQSSCLAATQCIEKRVRQFIRLAHKRRPGAAHPPTPAVFFMLGCARFSRESVAGTPTSPLTNWPTPFSITPRYGLSRCCGVPAMRWYSAYLLSTQLLLARHYGAWHGTLGIVRQGRSEVPGRTSRRFCGALEENRG